MTDLITTSAATPISSAMQAQQLAEREMRQEMRYTPLAVTQNKGEVIPLTIKNTLTAQKLGQNLRHYFRLTGRDFVQTDLVNVPEIANRFADHWRKKLTDNGKDQELLDILATREGMQGVENYLAAEILRERSKAGMIMNKQARFILACVEMYRENRSNCHEAIQKGFKDANAMIRQEFARHGIRFDGRQQAALDAIININVQKAVDALEGRFLSLFDKQQQKLLAELAKYDQEELAAIEYQGGKA